MYGNRRKTFLLSAALIGGAMFMTACQDTDAGAAQGSSSAAPSGQTSTPSGSSDAGSGQGDDGKGSAEKPSGGADASSGAGSDKGSDKGTGKGDGKSNKVEKCRTSGLEITAADATIGGDNDNTVAVELKNTGATGCALSGFAGVDLKTSAGSLSAKRTSEPVVPTILKSGETTAFGIHYPANKSGGSGVRVTGLVVTPPNETKSVTLAWPGSPTLPVTDGSGSPVTVGPIGSAGQGGAR